MSDIYLELRSRIPVVAARTQVGTTRLQDAQDRVGLSNESIARLIPVSEKTWRRWKEAGAIPTAVLPAVARALRLELVQPEGLPLGATPSDGVDGLRQEVAAMRDQVSRMEAMLQQLLEQRRPARARS